MQVQLKLFASLTPFLPPGAERNIATLDIPDDTSVLSLLDQHNVPREHCHLVLVNGVFHPPEQRDKVILKHGDQLAVWPPVAGG